MPRMRWRPGLRPGPRWGAHDAPPDLLSAGEGDTPPQELHPFGAFGASILAPSTLAARRFGASFLAYITHLYF